MPLGATLTPQDAGPDPDQDKNNPFNKKWENQNAPTKELSKDDVDQFTQDVEDYANDPKNSTKKPNTAEAEAGANGIGGNNSATLPGEKINYNPEKKKKKRVPLTRKQKYAVAATGFLGGSILFAAIPLLAPLKLMQFGTLLRQVHFFNNESFNEDRSSRIYRYLRRGSIQGTRLGVVSNKLAKSWDNKILDNSGVRLLYNNVGVLSGVEIFDEGKARSSGILDELDGTDGIAEQTGPRNDLTVGAEGVDFEDTGKRRLMIDRDGAFNDVIQRKERSLIRKLINSNGDGKVSSFVGARVLKKLSGVGFHPIDTLQQRTVSAGVDRWQAYRESRTKQHRNTLENGFDPPNLKTVAGDTTVDENGDRVYQQSGDTNTGEIANEGNKLKSDFNAPDADLPELKSRILSNLRTASGAAAVIAVMCSVRDFGESAAAQRFTNTVKVMERIGMEGIAVSSQIAVLGFEGLTSFTGGSAGSTARVPEIWYAMRYFWDLMTDEEGRDAFSGITAQAAMGTAPVGSVLSYNNPEIDPNARYDIDNRKPAFFEILDKVPFLGTACSVQNGILGAIGSIPVIGNIVQFVGDVQGAALNKVVGVTGYTMEEIIGGLINFVAGPGVDALARGPARMNLAMYGSLYAAGEQALSFGGRLLSVVESAELDQEQRLAEQRERQSKSLFARLTDLTDTKSIASVAVIGAPATPKKASNSLLALLNPVNSIGSIGYSSVTARAQAVTGGFDYGVPEVGFSVSERESELIEDPFANAQIVEDNFEDLNSRYGKCFPTKLVLSDSTVEVEVPTLDEEPVNQFTLDDDCREYFAYASDPKVASNDPGVDQEVLAANSDLLRFRAYLSDVINTTSLTCYEGDGQACTALGANSEAVSFSPSTGGTTGQTIADFTGPFIDCKGSPREQVFINEPNNVLNWSTISPTGVIGTDSGGNDIPVYIRDACSGQTNVRTIVLASGIHGLENGGQRIAWELLFNTDLPPDVRVIAIPEVSPWATANSSRTNANGVNLNRNFDYEWGTKSRDNPNPGNGNYRGPSPASEPETQAIQNFLTTLGKTSFLASYHSNLNYVASSGPNQKANEAIEDRYYQLALPYNITNRSGANWRTADESGTGFLEGWYNYTTGTPSFLLELTDSARTTTEYAKGHADTIKQLLEEGVIK